MNNKFVPKKTKYFNVDFLKKRDKYTTQKYLPELLSSEKKYNVIELSMGIGVFISYIRDELKHNILGTDYLNFCSSKSENKLEPTCENKNCCHYRSLNDNTWIKPLKDRTGASDINDWRYKDDILKRNIPYKLFDGGYVPYPIKNKEFDFLICRAALEAYCHPNDWSKLIDEFVRITKKKIYLEMNGPPKYHNNDKSYCDAFKNGLNDIKNYNNNNFKTTLNVKNIYIIECK
jgi:ubiquinone/menaquinone biosynthesis C-methylase UbiE